jgi:hypothetical protein
VKYAVFHNVIRDHTNNRRKRKQELSMYIDTDTSNIDLIIFTNITLDLYAQIYPYKYSSVYRFIDVCSPGH